MIRTCRQHASMPQNSTAPTVEKEDAPKSIGYWTNYYRDNPHPVDPSAFALEAARHLKVPGSLIELGCGNGRDAVFLSGKVNGHTLAIDQCAEEMAVLNTLYGTRNLGFIGADFSTFSPTEPPQYVYSRWTMHAIDEAAEDRTLDWVAKSLQPGGLFLVEARSIRDDLYGKGEVLGGHAFFTDHYRRFMDPVVFMRKLEDRGLAIEQWKESRGLAVYKQDDPMIVRVVAVKR